MEDKFVNEALLREGGWSSFEIEAFLEDAVQRLAFVEMSPKLPVRPCDCEEVGDLPFACVGTDRVGRCEKADDDARRLKKGEPVIAEPSEGFHAPDYTPPLAAGLDLAGDVRPRQDESFPWDADDPFVTSAACAEGELPGCAFRDVHADDGKIAIFEFEDVRAAIERRGLRSVGVWIGSETTDEHGNSVDYSQLQVKRVFSLGPFECPSTPAENLFPRTSSRHFARSASTRVCR